MGLRERERLREVESERARDHEQNRLLLYLSSNRPADRPTERANEWSKGARCVRHGGEEAVAIAIRRLPLVIDDAGGWRRWVGRLSSR